MSKSGEYPQVDELVYFRALLANSFILNLVKERMLDLSVTVFNFTLSVFNEHNYFFFFCYCFLSGVVKCSSSPALSDSSCSRYSDALAGEHLTKRLCTQAAHKSKGIYLCVCMGGVKYYNPPPPRWLRLTVASC